MNEMILFNTIKYVLFLENTALFGNCWNEKEGILTARVQNRKSSNERQSKQRDIHRSSPSDSRIDSPHVLIIIIAAINVVWWNHVFICNKIQIRYSNYIAYNNNIDSIILLELVQHV